MKPRWFGLLMVLVLRTSIVMGQTKTAPTAKEPRAASVAGFDALVNKAAAARDANQTDEAIRLYKQVVRTRPQFAEGWWYLGTLFYDMDENTDGRAAFRHVTGLKPDMALGWAMLGLCEFETKDFGSALAHLARADQLGIPNEQSFHDVAKYHLALLLARSGQFESAIGIIADFVSHGKDGPAFTEAMGLAALRKPLLPAELPPVERELVLDVGHAMCDAAAKRLADTTTDMAALLSKYPNTPQIHFLAGSIDLPSDSDKALDEWKAELVISPTHPQALVSIAGEYLKRAEYQSALPYAEKAAAANPGYYAAHTVLGQVLAEGGIDVPRGTHEIEIAARLAPLQPQVRFALATAYAKAGRKEDAARERAEFLRLRGQSAVALSTPR